MTKHIDHEDGMAKAGLFEDLPQPSEAQQVQQAQATLASKRSQGAVRLLQPNRLQVELRASDLESLLPEDHRARLVWGYVARQDLSKLVGAVKARGSSAGRAEIDPHILFALWLYATLDGVGSGREVTRLSQEHDAYRWICGGVLSRSTSPVCAMAPVESSMWSPPAVRAAWFPLRRRCC